MKDVKMANLAFENFLNEVVNIRRNIEEEREYARGYLQCMADLVKEFSSDDERDLDNGFDDNFLVNIVKRKIDMDSRSKLIDELVPGLKNLLEAYKGKC